jgi:DNA-binding PadR family transcriptional regulator
MSDSRLPATAYVVLGLVSVRPAAGHELAGFAGRSVGNFFPLTRSHIYLELDRLCRLGLLDATEVKQERLPTKRVYEITAAGAETLRRWLEDVDPPAERMRNLFLVRVFFGDRMTPARMASLLDEYAAAARINRDRLAVLVERLSERPEAVFRRSTAMFGVRQEQAKLDWVADVRPLLLDAAVACGEWHGDAPPEETRC